MGLEFDYPWALLLLPLALGGVYWTNRHYRIRAHSLKNRVTLGARLALVLLLALAMAGPSALAPTGASITWVLLDVSDSTATVQSDIQRKLTEAFAGIPKGEQAGLIAFGANAMVETPLSGQGEFAGIRTAVRPDGSDLAEALRLAGALIPEESAGRVLVISDGQTNDPKAMAVSLAARGIEVDALPLAPKNLPDAQVSQISVPREIYEGQAFSIEVTVDSNFDTTGTLVLYQNQQPTATRDVTLRKGNNLFVFQDTAQKSGIVTYEARLLAQGDQQSRNNSASAYVNVSGSPNVLLVEGRPASGREMTKMMTAAGMCVNRALPEEMPASAEELRRYDAIVLANVDADEVGDLQWLALETAVRSLGRGLCVLGGDSAYALGGYRGSPLENMLPVTIDVRNKLQMPALSLMLVIDKSGSMTQGQFGTTRLELAKEAAMRSTEVLTEKDQIGVIAFDDAAKWVVPLQKVTDVQAIQDMIGTIRPGGGTMFFTALEQSVAALILANTPQKHLILLSDGEPADRGFEGEIQKASDNGITVTTVAVGKDANAKLMELIATIGNGRAYLVDEFDNIPKIFTKETFLAGESYVQNRAFIPVVAESSSLTDFDGFPWLDGYLTAVEKPLATVSLISDRDDPILSWWPYGAGTVLAWTSDSEGAWTRDFLMWEKAPAFFGGLVSKTLSHEARDGVVEADTRNGVSYLRYTLPEGTAAAEEGIRTVAYVLLPDGGSRAMDLTQTEAGVYEGSFPADAQGAYALRVEQRMGEKILRVKEGGAVVGFAEEYDLR
ncbi:MAG: VWA domain-containing protein, partial [Clostridia bacterium]|nr:VWA domain-containing protein [Clostridia bacterium]